MDGGMKMQMSCIWPPMPGSMQACIRWSLDSRRGKLGGTSTLPCLVVTIIVPGAGVLSWGSAVAGVGTNSVRSTGAQSISWQHSSGYQSCAAAGVAARRKVSNSFLDMTPLYLFVALG